MQRVMLMLLAAVLFAQVLLAADPEWPQARKEKLVQGIAALLFFVGLIVAGIVISIRKRRTRALPNYPQHTDPRH